MAGPERLLTGAMLVLAILFAVGGAAQVGLAVFFLVRGDPVVHLPPEQPSEELSISLGGWLPLGALGVVMLALAWVTLRARRSSRREAGATG